MKSKLSTRCAYESVYRLMRIEAYCANTASINSERKYRTFVAADHAIDAWLSLNRAATFAAFRSFNDRPI